MSGKPAGSTEAGTPRLESWKEIAAYLKKTVRTVQRWEREEQLPVHRHLHRSQGAVYAYPSELDAWWIARDPASVQKKKQPARTRLAVIPFVNLTADPGQEYFSDGFTEELISQLGRLSPDQLSVIGRASSQCYKNSTKSLAQTAKELRVTYVLTGSVRRSGYRVRITATLNSGADETQVWSNSYERDLSDVFALQSDVARAVAREVSVQLGRDAKLRLSRAHPVNPEAYECYLKGRHHLSKRTVGAATLALEFFHRSIALDPDDALPHTGVSDAYQVLASLSYDAADPREVMPKAKEAIARALSLDPFLSNAQLSLANVTLVYDWDHRAAEKLFRKAIDGDPANPIAHHWYAHLLIQTGRFDEALTELKIARELDPLSLPVSIGLAWHAYMARDFEGVVKACNNVMDIDPSLAPAHMVLAMAYDRLGRFDEALAQLTGIHEVAAVSGLIGRIQARAGKTEAAEAALARLRTRAQKKFVPSIFSAVIYAALGRPDEAITALKAGIEERHESMLYLGVEPGFDNLRSDERFQALLSRIGLTQPRLADVRGSRGVPRPVACSEAAFAPGHVLVDRFRIVRLLGRGGMGEVYEAEDTDLGGAVALKTLRAEIALDPATMSRFRTEVALARQVTHPNVCRTFEIFSDRSAADSGEITFLAMEMLSGVTLAEHLKQAGRIPVSEAVPIVRDVLAGLSAAHDSGVVHGDLKPGNVFLHQSARGRRAVITDFGLACRHCAPGDETSSDVVAVVQGTPAYMAPEQLDGRPATTASDIYALGVIMYEMLTGALPLSEAGITHAIRRRTREDVKLPSQLVRGLDKNWEVTILRCLQRDPDSRFAGVSEISRALNVRAAHA